MNPPHTFTLAAPAPWWVRLLAPLIEREARAGHIKLTRSLTYHECLQLGCTETQANDYVNRYGDRDHTVSWRGHPVLHTKATPLVAYNGLEAK
jgi:hypothetical protein